MVFILCPSSTFVKMVRYDISMPRLRTPTVKPATKKNETVGRRIAFFRKRLGVTQQQLADFIGVSRNMIADYENNRVRIYDDMIKSLSAALNVSADELLGISASNAIKESALSLRIVKRMKAIQNLPAAEQKAVIKFIDMALQSKK